MCVCARVCSVSHACNVGSVVGYTYRIFIGFSFLHRRFMFVLKFASLAAACVGAYSVAKELPLLMARTGVSFASRRN